MTILTNTFQQGTKQNFRLWVGETIIGMALLLFLASFALAADGSLPSGQKTFEGKCSQCHGKDAKGLSKMAKVLKVEPTVIDLTRPEAVKMTDADLTKTVTDGNKKMPKFKGKLTDDQIQEAVKYVRSLQAANAGKK